MKKIIFLTILLKLCIVNAQSSNTEAALYNIGLGSIGSGIGAVINKKPNEKTGKVFLKGLWQGAIGGALIFGSKKIVHEVAIQEKIELNWPAKILNAGGTSIIENAASNRDFWSVWHINFGFNRFEFDTRGKFSFRYKVLPGALGFTIGTAFNSKPEWDLMLRTGEVIFSANSNQLGGVNGRTLGLSIRIQNNALNSEILFAHELIHIYQYHDFNFVTSYTLPLINKTLSNKFINQINKFIHWDTNLIVLGALYQLENINTDCYYDNYFEHEARYYSLPIFDCE